MIATFSYTTCLVMLAAFQLALDMTPGDETLFEMRQRVGKAMSGDGPADVEIDLQFVDDALIVLGMMSSFVDEMPPLMPVDFDAARRVLLEYQQELAVAA